MDTQPTPFADLDHYLDQRRVAGLALSPAGDRLVVGVSVLDEKRVAYVSSLWEVDPDGERPARRLTWGAKSESAPVFHPDGSLIFSSGRPDPGAAPADDVPPALWVLPAGAGEARPLAVRPGGIGAVAIARDAGTLVLGSLTMPSAVTADDDAQRRKARKEAKVGAILHDAYPIRFWDADLGPDRTRLFVAGPSQDSENPLELRELTGPGRPDPIELGSESSWSVSPDGSFVVVSRQQPEPAGSTRQTLIRIDVATGEHRVLLADPAFEYTQPVISPDGGRVALLAERRPHDDIPSAARLLILDLVGPADSVEAGLHDPAPGWDRWAAEPPVWTPDGRALLVVADDHGRAPVWRIDLERAEAVALTGDAAAYSGLQLARDGSRLFALRSAVDAPPAPVRLDPVAAGQQPVFLPGPVPAPALPGRVTELSTTVDDGTTIRGWLALPPGPDPAPLLLWIHGGPMSSWKGWSWRWNPWLAVARGYAVLLPDPALSTGYGQAGIDRGWARWGQESYTDVMALTDAAVARDDIDAGRAAAMGGSFGGYLANWIAGHTDRFAGIVSHAGLWSLDQFGPTTDAYHYWRRMMSEQMRAENSPHRHVARIRTPMLVIHGDRDYRVPIGEALRLWAELTESGTDPAGPLPHRLLVFPDENHWVLKPQNAKLWYQTVFAFLAHTVHGEPWEAPDLLR